MASALMGGDGATTIAAADKLAGIVSDRTKREVPWTQPIAAARYSAHGHFSAPETVLALPAPDSGFPFVRAHWHYARGIALARLGRAEDARGGNNGHRRIGEDAGDRRDARCRRTRARRAGRSRPG